jgi:hypothetical protein
MIVADLVVSGHGDEGSSHYRATAAVCGFSKADLAAGRAHRRTEKADPGKRRAHRRAGTATGQGTERLLHVIEGAVKRYSQAAEKEHRPPQEDSTRRAERS